MADQAGGDEKQRQAGLGKRTPSPVACGTPESGSTQKMEMPSLS